MQFQREDLHLHKSLLFNLFFLFLLILFSIPLFAQKKVESSHNPVEWRKLLSEKGSILYKDYFPGVNLILSGNQNRLIANMILSPGRKLSDISLDFINGSDLQIGNENHVIVQNNQTKYRMKAPVFVQAVKGKKQEITGSYYNKEKNQIGITDFVYDKMQPLVITIELNSLSSNEHIISRANPILTPQVVNITATNQDEVVPDLDNNNAAVAGDTIKYTVTIQNSGDTDAITLAYDVTVDANTTLQPGTVKTTPLAYKDTVTTGENEPVVITLTGIDADGGSLTFSIDTDPTKGTLGSITPIDASSAQVTYTPGAGENGADSFIFKVTDADNNTKTAEVVVNIIAAVPPVAENDSYNTMKNVTLTVPDGATDLLSNDFLGAPEANLISFGGGSLGGTVTDNAAGASVSFAGGTLTVNANGSFTLTTPATTGSFTFQYRISNTAGNSDATVTIEVREAPTAAADNYITDVNTTVSRSTSDTDDLLDNDTRGFPLANITNFGAGSLGGAVTDNAAGATVAFAGGSLTVNADGSFTLTTPATTGSFTFQYRITNTAGTSDAVVTIEVEGPPVAVDDAPVSASVPGNAFHTAFNTTLNSSTDANTPSLISNDDLGFPVGTLSHFGGGSLGGAVTDNAAGATVNFGTAGSLQVNADGEFIFTPDNNFTGLFTFEYRLTNSAGTDDGLVTIAVGVRPSADADSYTASGNIDISVTPGNGVFNGDTGDQISITEVQGGANVGVSTATTAAGRGAVTGFVTLNADGSFSYTPPPGYNGNDTFTYKVGNGFGNSSAATVTVTISNMVWFISNNAGGNNRGTFNDPFTSIASFNTANTGTAPDGKTGDVIALRTGSGTYTETDGVNLLNNQKLIGNGVQFSNEFIADANSSSAYTSFAGSAGTAPNIVTTAGDGVDLASGNTLKGFNIGDTPGFFGLDGTAVGSLVVSSVNITGTGGIIKVATSGTFGNTVSFGTLSSSSSPGSAIDLTGVTGTLALTSGGTGIGGTAASSPAVNISAGTLGFTYPGNITKGNAGSLVKVAGGHNTGTITFNTGTLSATAGDGLQFDNADGTYNFNGTTTLNGGDAGIDVLNGSGGTFSFSSGMAITNPTNNAIKIDAGNANVTYSGTFSKNNNGVTGILISNNTGGIININGTGTKLLSTTTANAVNLTSNNGAAINFSGNNLSLTTTTGVGFNATGGGTVTVTGTGNTISSTSATALNVTSTTIGSGNLNFQSISSGNNTAAADPVNGIVLNNTGASGGLTVTGDGGGSNNGSGGTIQNTTGDGVLLTTVANVRLNYMGITNNLGDGIGGSGINGFQLNRCNITGNGNDAASDESGINITELTGSGIAGSNPTSITNCTISNNNEFELQITNTTGTLTDFQMSGNTISSNGLPINGNVSSPHGNLVNFLALGTANMKTTVTSGSFTGNWNPSLPPATITATAMQCDHSGTSGTMTANISGATFINNNVGPQASVAGGGTVLFNFSNNTVTGSRAIGINIFADANAPFTKSMTGTIQNNIIGTFGVANSGANLGNGIRVQNEGSIPMTLLITGNTIQEVTSFPGININVGISSSTGGQLTSATITNNTVRNIGSRAIVVQDNAGAAPFPTICANISGNVMSNISGQAGDGTFIRIRQLSGIFNVTQASLAALEAANTCDGGSCSGKFAPSGTITYGQPICSVP